MKTQRSLTLLLTALLAVGACTKQPASQSSLESIVILATNDIHGGLEPSAEKDGIPLGGMALWSGVVSATRKGQKEKSEPSDVFLLDAGDQFQGTLLSNIDEGELLLKTMVKIGYDAIIPGNHDYDFGPAGWLKDKIATGEEEGLSKEILKKLTRAASGRFPFLSANTYRTQSLHNPSGSPLTVSNNFCVPTTADTVDWSDAKRPEFLRPYTILTSPRLSARIAIVGLDNPKTASQTMLENVSDLCFRDPYETYLEIRRELEGQADIFLIVIHDGDTDTTRSASRLAERLSRGGRPLVDAIIAGHTHFVNNERPNQVPVIQSGSGGRRFGRIDLVWDTQHRQLLRDRTTQYAGVRLLSDGCDPQAKAICEVRGGTVHYDGVAVLKDTSIQEMIARAREELHGLDRQIVGEAKDRLTRDRISESPLGNLIADGLLTLARTRQPKTQVAFINAGGLRNDLPAGPVNFEQFFTVLPFNNHGVVIGPMKTKDIVSLIQFSVKTCGQFGTLLPAGLRVEFERTCPKKQGDLDPHAKLLKMERIDSKEGEPLRTTVIYDPSAHIEPQEEDTLLVATLDFLASGGENFTWLKQPLVEDIGVVREELTKLWTSLPQRPEWEAKLDGRWHARPRFQK